VARGETLADYRWTVDQAPLGQNVVCAGCAIAAPAARLEIAAKAFKRRRLFMKAP
jgi:hypothetical protein